MPLKDKRIARTAGIIVLAIGAMAALGLLVVKDQFSRHRRDLFSTRPLKRLAALGYLAGREPSVESVQVLRDYLTWEPRPLIRRRAAQILARMERALEAQSPTAGELAG